MAIVGVPKTIDNDLAATDYTFGFWTAIEIATDALDRLRDTAESHHRVMILEVMGRDAGWIALHAGLAGAADVILIPEIPYRIQAVEAKIEERAARGQSYSLVVVAEGASPRWRAAAPGGWPTPATATRASAAPGDRLARELAPRIEHEIRVTVLGHLQRGGSPVPFDRILATRLGRRAAEAAAGGRFGTHGLPARRPGRRSLARRSDRRPEARRPEGRARRAPPAPLGVGFGDEAL